MKSSRRQVTGISGWTHLMSYLSDQTIEVVTSQINGDLEVILRKGRLQLCTANAVYSYDDRYDNFRLLLEAADWSGRADMHVLCLGLGLGSIPILLEKYADHILRLTSVEYDPVIIQLARKYGMSKAATIPHDVVWADAAKMVSTSSHHYDLIISDLFHDDEIPEVFLSKDYLYQLQDLMSPEAWLFMNTLAYTDADRKKSMAYFEHTFQAVFPEAACYHCWENYMLVHEKGVVDLPEVTA